MQAGNLVLLNPDGTLTVSVRVRCDPGWVFQEVDAIVDQGASVFADGITSAPVPCDGRWHRVQFDLVTRSGTFQPGKVTFSLLQFGVSCPDQHHGAPNPPVTRPLPKRTS